MGLLHPTTLLALGYLLWLWRGLKVAKRWCEVGREGGREGGRERERLTMERSQNWLDLRSPISKFWYIHFIAILICINRWKFQGIIQSVKLWRAFKRFMKWGHLTWPGDMTLSDVGLKFLQHMLKGCMNRCAKKRWTIWKHGVGEGEVSTLNSPHPIRAKVRLRPGGVWL